MTQFVGILGFIGFAIAIVGLAAGSTWLIVRLFPAPEDKAADEAAAASQPGQ